MLGVSAPEELIPRLKASGLRTPVQVNAARRIYATYIDHVNNKRVLLSEAQKKGNPGEIAAQRVELGQAMAQLLDAQSVIAPGATTAGRILNTFRMMASPVSEGETFAGRFKGALRAAGIKAHQIEGLHALFNDAIDGKTSDRAFLDALTKATSPSRLDKVLEFWKAGLLGWPTQIANVSSNAMFQGINRLEEGLAAGMDAVRAKLTGTERERFLGELSVRLAAQRKAFSEGLRLWSDDLVGALSAKTTDVERIRQLAEFDPRRAAGAIEGKKGEFIRIPFKSLDAADNFFKYVAHKGEMSARAYRLAQQEGYRIGGETAAKAQARILTELEEAAERPLTSKYYAKYKDQIKAANNSVKRSVFQAPLNESWIGRLAKTVSQGTQQFKPLQFLIPFTHTPANIIHELTVRTPIGFATVYNKWKKGQLKVSGEMMDELAKAAFGSAALGGFIAAGMEGKITGGGPNDPTEQENLKATGWQPYSFKLGDQYISYQRFEPMSSILGIAGDIADAYKNGEIDKPRELIAHAFTSAATNVTNKTFLSGLEGLTSAWHDPERYGAAFIKQLTGSVVPNILGPIPVATLARAADPVYRQTEAFNLSPAIARIPGLSQTLPEQLTPSGAVRERPGTFIERLLAPFTRTEVQTGPGAEAAQEFNRLGWAPRKPERQIKFPDGTRVDLTPEEVKVVAGAREKAIQAASRLIKTSEYKKLPDEEDITGARVTKKDVLQRLITQYQRAALAHIRPQLVKRGRQQERQASL